MKKSGPLSLLVLGMAALYTPSEAIYKFQFVHGNNCTSITPGATPAYTEYGLSNPTNTDITVTCPVVPDTIANLKNIRYSVYAWNRNNARKLSCTLSTTAMMGGVSSSTTVIFPYDVGAFGLKTGTTTPQPNYSPIPYMTCFIPGMENGWVSYLSTINLRYEY